MSYNVVLYTYISCTWGSESEPYILFFWKRTVLDSEECTQILWYRRPSIYSFPSWEVGHGNALTSAAGGAKRWGPCVVGWLLHWIEGPWSGTATWLKLNCWISFKGVLSLKDMVWVFRTDSFHDFLCVFWYCCEHYSRNLDFALLSLGENLHPYSHIHYVARFWLVNWWSLSFLTPRKMFETFANHETAAETVRGVLEKYLSNERAFASSIEKKCLAICCHEHPQHPLCMNINHILVESSIAVTYVTFTLKLTVQYLHGFTNARLQEFLFCLWMDNISEENPPFQRFQPWTRQPYDQLLLEIINQGKDDLEKAWFRSEHSEELINEDGTLAVLFAKVV